MRFGVVGGPVQPWPWGHAQIVIRLRDYKQNAQAACAAPRWRVLDGLGVAIEQGFEAGVLEALRERGHLATERASHSSLFFGRAQLVYRLNNGLFAASDHRCDGQAAGF